VSEVSVFRPGDVSYIRIPTSDVDVSAAYYRDTFGWNTSDSATFSDLSGHVIGHFMTDLGVVGEAGIVPYVYVADIDESLAKVVANGGAVTTEPYAEGTLWVSVTKDPTGNAIGVWQNGPRSIG